MRDRETHLIYGDGDNSELDADSDIDASSVNSGPAEDFSEDYEEEKMDYNNGARAGRHLRGK